MLQHFAASCPIAPPRCNGHSDDVATIENAMPQRKSLPSQVGTAPIRNAAHLLPVNGRESTCFHHREVPSCLLPIEWRDHRHISHHKQRECRPIGNRLIRSGMKTTVQLDFWCYRHKTALSRVEVVNTGYPSSILSGCRYIVGLHRV